MMDFSMANAGSHLGTHWLNIVMVSLGTCFALTQLTHQFLTQSHFFALKMCCQKIQVISSPARAVKCRRMPHFWKVGREHDIWCHSIEQNENQAMKMLPTMPKMGWKENNEKVKTLTTKTQKFVCIVKTSNLWNWPHWQSYSWLRKCHGFLHNCTNPKQPFWKNVFCTPRNVAASFWSDSPHSFCQHLFHLLMSLFLILPS